MHRLARHSHPPMLRRGLCGAAEDSIISIDVCGMCPIIYMWESAGLAPFYLCNIAGVIDHMVSINWGQRNLFEECNKCIPIVLLNDLARSGFFNVDRDF